MYVRTKKINGSYYNYLVESVREGKRVVQKHIKYLGKTSIHFLLNKAEYIIVPEDNYFLVYKDGVMIKEVFNMEHGENYIIARKANDFIQYAIDQNQSIVADYSDSFPLADDYLYDNKDFRGSVNTYLGNGYKEINESLRVTHKYNNFERLDKWTNLFSTSKKTIVYRGSSNKFLEKLSVGDEFTDNGFCSTSIEKDKSEYFERGVMSKIILPKGTKYGIGKKEELEMILPRGTKFKLKSKKLVWRPGKKPLKSDSVLTKKLKARMSELHSKVWLVELEVINQK